MILKSFVLVEKDSRYLLICEASKKWKGKWFLPGGKVEDGESPESAAHRETKEEAGCDINVQGLFHLRYNSNFFDHYIALFFAATIAGEEILKQVADKHSLEVRWFTYEEIMTLPVRQNLPEIINMYRSGHLLPISGFQITDM